MRGRSGRLPGHGRPEPDCFHPAGLGLHYGPSRIDQPLHQGIDSPQEGRFVIAPLDIYGHWEVLRADGLDEVENPIQGWRQQGVLIEYVKPVELHPPREEWSIPTEMSRSWSIFRSNLLLD